MKVEFRRWWALVAVALSVLAIGVDGTVLSVALPTLAGALQIAAKAPKGTNILAMMPDTGERYLSTPLFADIPADMTPEEIEILKSSPMFAEPAPAA